MTHFLAVLRLEELPPGRAVAVAVEHGSVALFNVDGDIRAVDDACIQCLESLALGRRDGFEVTCRKCGWRYDLLTGRNREVPALRLDTFDVHVTGSIIALAHCTPRGDRDV